MYKYMNNVSYLLKWLMNNQNRIFAILNYSFHILVDPLNIKIKQNIIYCHFWPHLEIPTIIIIVLIFYFIIILHILWILSNVIWNTIYNYNLMAHEKNYLKSVSSYQFE